MPCGRACDAPVESTRCRAKHSARSSMRVLRHGGRLCAPGRPPPGGSTPGANPNCLLRDLGVPRHRDGFPPRTICRHAIGKLSACSMRACCWSCTAKLLQRGIVLQMRHMKPSCACVQPFRLQIRISSGCRSASTTPQTAAAPRMIACPPHTSVQLHAQCCSLL